MWGRKDELNDGQEPTTTTTKQAETVSTPPPAARTAPSAAPSSAPDRNRAIAQIGKSLKIKGSISGSEDLFVDGEIEGTIELEENNLTIGPNGNVNADVKARDITILGRLNGDVQAGERTEIRKTGSLSGNLRTSRIVIEDGAVFRGSIDIVKPGQASAGSPIPKPVRKSEPETKKAGMGGSDSASK